MLGAALRKNVKKEKPLVCSEKGWVSGFFVGVYCKFVIFLQQLKLYCNFLSEKEIIMVGPESQEIDLKALKDRVESDLDGLLTLAKEKLAREPIAKLEQMKADVMPITVLVQSILQNNEAITKAIKGIRREEMSRAGGREIVYLATWDSADGIHHNLEFIVDSTEPLGDVVLESYLPANLRDKYLELHPDQDIPSQNRTQFTKLTPLREMSLAASEIELDDRTVATDADFKKVFISDEDDAGFQMPHSSPAENNWVDYSLLLALHEADFNFGPREFNFASPAENPLEAVKKATRSLADALGQYDHFDKAKGENEEVSTEGS